MARSIPSYVTERNFNRLVIGAMALGLLALVAAGGGAVWAVLRNQDNARSVNHTYEVERTISDLRIAVELSETARRGFLLKQDPTFVERFETSQVEIPLTLAKLKRLTADNARQQARIPRLTRLLSENGDELRRTIDLARSGTVLLAVETFRTDRTVSRTRVIRALAAEMVAEENRLLDLRTAAQRQSVRTFFVILGVVGVLIVLVGAGSLWLILIYIRDLSASRNEMRRMNDTLEDAVKERTVELTRANEEIQRFAYIVSHDLRSPLVNVMGFTSELEATIGPLSTLIDAVETNAPQLLTDDARLAVREDLPESIGFIRTSTQKMDRLINAILRLSREGRRVITPERVQMEPLIESIGGSLQHRLDSVGAELVVEDMLPDIVSDRLALEQIFSNLIENAVKYLKPGRPGRIVVRGMRRGARIIYEVEDNGRGIDPKDHERVFDLFRRSGTQDQPGEGIGLAHVRALAYRLGGVIGCDSALDRGATFRLSLPAQFAGDQGVKAA